jgi:2-dehydro-3-deoxyphosphogluconate aldolase / (4S)-4-hydroxy-2-oxoglutarate aldolase
MSDAAMQERQRRIDAVLALGPVIPVVVIDRVDDAVPLARALLAGGVRVIEVTLRTPVALDAIRAIAREVTDAVVGAGTVLTSADLRAAQEAGATFAVAPGHSPRLLDAADHSSLPLLPGAATASEAMTLLERGYRSQKFFPAAAAGGIAMLRSLGGPLPHVRFCATGGIDARDAADYLALGNVACVGGSWLTSAATVRSGDWDTIMRLAREATSLRQ